MGNKTPITGTVLKGHRLTVTIEDPIFKALDKNTGTTKQFKDYSHAINYSLAEVLKVKES